MLSAILMLVALAVCQFVIRFSSEATIMWMLAGWAAGVVVNGVRHK